MVPRKAGTDWEILAPAKLNLYLEVLGKRPDGFHDLETLMVPVQLFDQVRWSPPASADATNADECSLSVESFALDQRSPCLDSLATSDNLVLRAARLLAERIGRRSSGHFHLIKRIPLQAGLGGGSSDAAATLRLANACWQGGLGEDELAELAAELGSDVPFFLKSGPAICRGRGERVSMITGLPKMHFVLVKPVCGLSTAEVFQKLAFWREQETITEGQSTDKLGKLLEALRMGAMQSACQWMINRLEFGAARLASEILRIKALLAAAGCWGQLLTGSGSTVFGLARTARHARGVARQLAAKRIGSVMVTATGW